MKNILELNSIKDALCKPYHIKLFAYVMEEEGDEGKYVNPKTAVDYLNDKDLPILTGHGKIRRPKNKIKLLMDSYI